MLKVFLATHGRMAEGMKSTIDVLTGGSPKLTYYNAYVDESCLRDRLEEFYKTVTGEDQVILISDMYGGSVNSEMYLFARRPNTMLVTGVNLALLIGILMSGDEITRDMLKMLIAQSREAMKVVEWEPEAEEEEQELF